MADLQKVDTGLFMAWQAYQESHDKDPEDGISISLRFEGDLQSIEALGFETRTVLGNTALGIIRFKDIEALDAHPGVVWMAAGQAPRAHLDTAVSDIKARASAPIGGPPVDGLWHAEVVGGAFTNVVDATGKDVFVGVIDTGIDYKHPMFMSTMGPPRKTRIFRIWDQGLSPAALAECPDPALLASNPDTYGVEYKQAEIDAALHLGPAINHKDCIGHGTHVAGIAAGGTKFFTPGGDAKFVGVAPEASIIAVKLLDTPNSIRYRKAAGFGVEVSHAMRFRDAVLYCLRLAKAEGKPIVINMSFGNSSEPGDGLDEDAAFMDELMDPIFPESSFSFPKKAVLVKAAGNDGDPVDRQTARIEVPASGQITVPVQLKDTKGATKTRWKECAQTIHKPPVGVDFWYRRATPFDSVKFALRLPDQTSFSGDMPIGGNLDRGFVPKVGPPPSVALVAATTNVHKARVRHEGNPPVNHPTGLTPLRRHKVAFWVEPKESGGTVSYHPGIYEIRIKAPAGTVIYAMCDRQFWARGLEVTFEIATTMMDGVTLPDPGIIVTNESSATDAGGRHIITVAAYDDKEGVAGPDKGEIAAFSSRGPLRDFSNPPLGPIAVKPDIAAPGVKITSAEGFDTEALLPRVPPWHDGIRFKAFRGTSMAAPMVAGVIALMLDKKADMDINEVRTHLNAVARAAVKPSTAPDSVNAYGSGMVDALESHKRLP